MERYRNAKDKENDEKIATEGVDEAVSFQFKKS